MPRVIHFEIVADNPERAMKFYKEVLVGSSISGMVLKTTGL
jgi:predicted enzyme related to lactoylglutathione lyase